MRLPLKRIGIGLATAVCLVAVGFGVRFLAARLPTEVRLDAAQRHQTIEGWAVYPRYWEDDKKRDRFDRSFEAYTEQVSEFLAADVGINAARIEIWSGLENPRDYWRDHYDGRMGYKEYARLRYEKVNDNDDPKSANPAGFQFSKFDHRIETMVLPLKRALEKRGEKLLVNVCYVDFKWRPDDPGGSLEHATQPQEFAEFVAVFFERLRDRYGIVPDAFEVILEPENTVAWRGRTIGQALIAVSDRLQQGGFSPRFIAPSNTSMRNAITYFDEMIEVPGVLQRLDTFAYHRYHLERKSEVEAIWQRARQHRLKTAMLEKVGAGIDVLLEDLTVGNVSGWQQWATADLMGAAPDGGAYYARVDASNPAAPRVTMSNQTHQLAQVFRYVRPGAVRIDATTNNWDKRVAAFIDPQGGSVVVVRASTAGGRVDLSNLPPGRYGRSFVGDDYTRLVLPVATVTAGARLETALPGPGVLTVHALHGAAPEAPKAD
jgi:hypothetical protein